MANFEQVGDCWRCEKLKANLSANKWFCITSSRWLGDPKLDAKEQCPDFKSEAGTDKAEYG